MELNVEIFKEAMVQAELIFSHIYISQRVVVGLFLIFLAGFRRGNATGAKHGLRAPRAIWNAEMCLLESGDTKTLAFQSRTPVAARTHSGLSITDALSE